MTLKINGATGGSVSLDAPDNTSPAGTDVTLTLPVNDGDAGQYLQTDGTGTLSWQTVEGLPDAIDVNASAPADSVNIDSSGRLLVGTSSGSSTLTVNGNIGVTSTSAYDNVFSNSSNRAFVISKTTASASDSNQIGFVIQNSAAGSLDVTSGFIQGNSSTSSLEIRNALNSDTRFQTNNTERMRITQAGNVVIGRTTAGDGRLTSYGSTTDGTDNTLYLGNSAFTKLFRVRNDGLFDTGTASYSPYNHTTSSSANLMVTSSGLIYRSTSSARFKTDIETLEDSYADAILNVNPVWYRSTAPGDAIHPNWGYYGFIAEDVGQIDPRLVFWKTHEVTQDEEGNETTVELDEPVADGVQYDRFVPHLLNLVKRQKEQLETQAASIASQAATIAALDARLTALEGGAA